MMKLKMSLVTGVLVCSLPFVASAAIFAESGDAGQSLATAQALPNGTSVVNGSLSSLSADLFSFGWGGGGFYVSTVGTPWDSQLFLFNSSGLGIQGNDDGIAYAGPAYLQLPSLAAGNYFLGVSGYDYDPYDTNSALMFTSYPYGPLYGPLTSAPLGDWAGGDYSPSNYTITFASITGQGQIINVNPVGTVPEPATMLLMGIGLAGLVGARKKKMQQ